MRDDRSHVAVLALAASRCENRLVIHPTRRELLRTIALGTAGLGAGCFTGRTPRAAPRLRLPPVRVSAEREIRTVVGLRPFRPEGFVVRAEKLGDKLVVHNYGHGGGGVTLSWGTSDLAVRLAMDSGARRAGVLGCGAVGLATARLLQQRGVAVTLYAAALPPDTTSNIAGAQVFPFMVCDRAALVPPFRDQFLAAAKFSFRWYQSMVGETYGVRWMTNYQCSDDPPFEDGLTGRNSPLREIIPDFADLAPDEHPFAQRYVRRFATLMVEPSVYLPALVRDVRLAGGTIVVRRFDSLAELAELPEPVLVNCTGLGAGALFGDTSLVPVKGQLTVLLPQPEVDYALLAGDLYMFSRRDGVLLGGTHERGVSTLSPNAEARERILAGHARIFGALVARSTDAG
jgi:glycine/D-amino acid oxidase-like deaminating enzyme